MRTQLGLLMSLLMLILSTSQHAQAQSETVAQHVVRVKSFTCTHEPAEWRTQTGFVLFFSIEGNSVSIDSAGTPGVITALHGVADCKFILALSEDGKTLDYLETKYVDIDRDVALLTSSDIEYSSEDGALEVAETGDVTLDDLYLFGYPYGIRAQLKTDHVDIRNPQKEQLSDLVPDGVRGALDRRNSPNLGIDVYSVEGHFLPGHSGAAVFNKEDRVVGVVNGGLQGGGAEISWMIPWHEIEFESIDDPAVETRLDKLEKARPEETFSYPGENDELSAPTPTSTPSTSQYTVRIQDSRTRGAIEGAKVTLVIGARRYVDYTDSDGFCTIEFRTTDRPGRIEIENEGYLDVPGTL